MCTQRPKTEVDREAAIGSSRKPKLTSREWLVVTILSCVACSESAGAGLTLSGAQLARLNKALEPYHARYDPAAKMLREPFYSPGYHTTLKGVEVHPTRSSLDYAVALLDTGDETLRRRAEDILRRVIALQDQDPASKTYGIWPWFLEEPLAKMSPPDWNWADFCGVQLLQVARDHRERLVPDLAAQVDAAIRHAARSIQRRNVGPDYTNIAIMGTYVTLVAAELYGWDDLRSYALDRLRRFYDYTRQHGAFTEYNSPTYSITALSELGRMRLHVKDAKDRDLVEELYRMAWEDIALHFHPPTRQWAGPHSRCYSTLVSRSTLAVIQGATEGRVDLDADEPSIFEQRLPLPCPRQLEHYFATLHEPREVVKTYLKAEPPVVGTTHLEPAFALGSANRSEFWNQRRALVAYWGSAAAPSYLHLRFLRDGYDFADAQFFSAQRGGDVLAAVNFGTDGGNTHIGLDRIRNGVFRARSLRLRFEFGGGAGSAQLALPAKFNEPSRLVFGDVQIQLVVAHAVFGGEKPRWESGNQNGTAWLDVVIYEGVEREFRLGEVQEAAIGLALRISKTGAAAPAVTSAVHDSRLALKWDSLRVSVPVRPDKVSALQRAVRY